MPKDMNDLFVLTGQAEDKDQYGWEGMPEFIQNDKDPYDEVTIRFRNQEDLEEFCRMIDQPNLSLPKKRKKNGWYPKHDRMANTLNRWFDESDMNDDDKEYIDYEDL